MSIVFTILLMVSWCISGIVYLLLYADKDDNRFAFLYYAFDDSSDRIWWKYTKRIIMFTAFAPVNLALSQQLPTFRRFFKKD